VSDKFARVLAGLAVLAVAVIAGIVSYSHIAALALSHGYSPDTARLLPLSVDGLIVASSLVLLVEARAQRPAPRLARAGLWIAISATLAANVMHGVSYGLVGALANAWPGAAFILASEILLGQMRRAGTTPAPAEAAQTVAAAVPEIEPVTVPEIEPVSVPAREAYPVPVATVRTVSSGRAPGSASRRTSKSPEKIFSAEIERGEIPSLREVKRRARCGTPRAREIRDELAQVLQEAPEAA
jgi:hypothetical protein